MEQTILIRSLNLPLIYPPLQPIHLSLKIKLSNAFTIPVNLS